MAGLGLSKQAPGVRGSSAFNSGTTRDFVCGKPANWNFPGPGTHAIPPSRSPPGGTAAFRAQHVHVSVESGTPGPGAYEVSTMASAISPHSSCFHGFAWSRLATSPSIPPPSQTLNLQDANPSALQRAPRPQALRPAPNTYSPQHTLTQRRPVVNDFGATVGREQPIMGLAGLQESPSPGAHFLGNSNPRPLPPPPSYAFRSCVPRGSPKEKCKVPSPHEYDPPPGMGSVKPVPRHVPMQRRHCSGASRSGAYRRVPFANATGGSHPEDA